MRLTSLIIAAYSLTGAVSFISAAPQAADAAADVAVDPASTDVVVEHSTNAVPNAITPMQRLGWWNETTVGKQALFTSAINAGWGTMLNHPGEAGPGIGGFGERYWQAVAGNALSNGMEASLGALWGEDPRYMRVGPTSGFKARMGRVALWTVAAQDRNGNLHPAYARFTAVTSSSFISNAWREPSESDASHALGRVAMGFAGRMGGNAFDEFWPDVKRKLFHHKGSPYLDSVNAFQQ